MLKILALSLTLILLSACASTHEDDNNYYQQTDLYDSNKQVQQPQAKAWGWLN